MKTTHIVLNDLGNTKLVQVELIPENDLETRALNGQNTNHFNDHIIFYLQKVFPRYVVLEAKDSPNFPFRTVVEIKLISGF